MQRQGRTSIPARACSIRVLRSATPSAIEVDYVCVPSLYGAGVEKWPVGQDDWLQSIHSIPTRQYRLLAFEYNSSLQGDLSVPTILERGEDLLVALLEFRNSTEVMKRPIIFLCHSVGGHILKKALCIANQQMYRFYTLLCAIVGIVFMGTPHTASQSLTILDHFEQCVRVTTKQRIRFPASEITHLMDLQRQFDLIQLQIAIASIYETRETKLKRRMMLPASRTIIVDRKSAATKTPHEQLIGLPLDHGTIYQLSSPIGVLNAHVEGFFTGVLVTAVDTIQQKLNMLNPLAGPIPTLVMEAVGGTLRQPESQVYLDQPQPNPSELQSIDDSFGIAGLTTSSFSYELVPMVSSFSQSERKAQLPCYMLEPHVRNPNFCGRASVLDQMRDVLLPTVSTEYDPDAEHTLRQFVICGLGGIGKTEIAVEFAYTHQKDFDAIFFIVADNTAKLDASFSQMAMELSLIEPNQPKNHVLSRELVKGWLCHPSKSTTEEEEIQRPQNYARWLLIFDNVDDTDILFDYWPQGGIGALLITSRDPLSKTIHSVKSTSVDLNPLDTEEAIDLLQSLTRVEGDLAKAQEVCDLLGGLPLAISQMAQIIRYQYLNYSTFIDRYNDDAQKRDLHHMNIKQRASYGYTLASVWAFESLDTEARSLLQVMAFYDPDCIQQRLLMADSDDSSFAGYPHNPAAFFDARAKLLHGSHIKVSTDANDISVHRLIQDSIRSQMPREDWNQALFIALNRLVAAWPPLDVANKHVTHRWKECQALFPHVLNISKAYSKAFERKAIDPDLRLATLLADAGWWQHEIGMSHSTNDVDLMFDLALSICSQSPNGGPQTLLVDIHHALGAIANETNQKRKCLEHTRREHELQMKRFQEDPKYDYRLGSAHCQLGIALLMNDDAQGAIERITASVEAFKLADGFTKGMLSAVYTNLGYAYLEAGQLDLASSVLETGIKDREELYGKLDTESFKAGFLHYALGNVRCAQGQLDAGFILHQQALFQYKASIGNNHHRTADACHKVAQHSIRLQAYSSAKALIEQALKVWNADREIYKPEIARTTHLKSILLRATNAEEADELLHEAIMLRQDLIPGVDVGRNVFVERDFDVLVTYWSR